MNIEEVFNILEKEKWLTRTIDNISKGTVSKEDIEDLSQDIYMRILTSTTTNNTIQRINNIDEIKYYLTRAISLELFSETSYFNQKYGRYNKKRDNMESEKITMKFYESE